MASAELVMLLVRVNKSIFILLPAEIKRVFNGE